VRAVRAVVAAAVLRAPCRMKRGCCVCGNAWRHGDCSGVLGSDGEHPKAVAPIKNRISFASLTFIQ
jgi:hypothetical protein